VATLSEKEVRFDGEGFAELDRRLLKHEPEEEESISFDFRSERSEGLLIFHGQKPETDGRGEDYLAVVLVNGHLEMSWELGGGPSQIRSKDKVDDGRWHRAILTRKGVNGKMILDDRAPQMGSSQGTMAVLNAKGSLYVGGLPDHVRMTGNRYPTGFSGCLSDLQFQTSSANVASSVINFRSDSIRTCNVQSCERLVNFGHFVISYK